MSDETVVRCCAPTLARIKTGSLFNCPFSSREDMITALLHLNRELRNRGVRTIPLRWQENKCLIYVYRPDMLARDLRNPAASRLLRECGYGSSETGACLAGLIQRLRGNADFPHEIGLFLGYPPADVDGFIHHRNTCKLKGFWKVYENEDSTRELFVRYRRCTKAYLRQYAKGFSLSRLCVRSSIPA